MSTLELLSPPSRLPAILPLTVVSLLHLLAIVFVIVIFYIVYYVYFHPLASIPGPTLAKITNWWRYHHYCQGSLHLLQADLFIQYDSPVVRVAPNSVIFSSPEAYKAIHALHHGLERGDFYTMIRFGDRSERSMFSTECHASHQTKRKKLVSVAMTQKAFRAYEHAIRRHRDLWLERIDDHLFQQGPQIDIADLNKALAFDAIYDVLTGESPNFQAVWNTPRFQRAIRHKEATNNIGFGWGFTPWRAKFLDRTFFPKIVFHRRIYDRENNPLLRTMIFWHWLERCEKVLLPAAKHRKSTQQRSNVLEMLATLPDSDFRKMRNDEEIMAEIRTMLFAGPGTTAGALISILYDLARHPSWQEAIRAEVMHLPDEQYSTVMASAPLLNAFMDESLRLRPMGPLAFPLTVSSAAGSKIPSCPISLPIGTEIGAVPWVINRDPGVWGADANDFKPDRWLVIDQTQLRRMREVWAVFGRGVKACPGERIAISLIHKCVAGLLQRYVVTAEDGALQGRCNFEMTFESLQLTLQPLHV